MKEEYILQNKDVCALVLSTNDDWDCCCITEYTKDGTWHCGLNLITSVKMALRCAEKNKLNIIFENMLNKEPQESQNAK